MRRARRNSLLALPLLLAAQAPLPHGLPSGPVSGREEEARLQVDEAERVRVVQLDAEREASAQAARALADERRLTTAQSAALDRLTRAETAVRDMTTHLSELDRSRAEAASRIALRAETLRPVLPVILRMSTWPVETLLSAQARPEDAVRGISVLRTLARQAEVDAHALTEDQAALAAATAAAAELAPRLAAAKVARTNEADQLARELADTRERRASWEQDAADAARRAAGEAARAKNLRSMLQILETQRRLEEAQAREDGLRAEREQKTMAVESARLRQAALARPTGTGTLAANARPTGQLASPVAGILLRGWGDPEDGEPASGMSFQTESGAEVVAPCGGTVAFAEPFRTYGMLVIIDCGGGYHAVLSGLHKIAIVPGRAVKDGDAVGTMPVSFEPANAPAATSGPSRGSPANRGPLNAGPTRQQATAPAHPVLYVELRKNGRPVNPSPWLKTNG